MPYDFRLTTIISASPQQVYAAWLDSVAHSEMTGGAATMSDAVDAEISAWDGYITGRNLDLVPGERIVQAWRTTQFTDAHDDSIVTVTLEPVDGGTLLTLSHSNVPDEQTGYEQGGWQDFYFEPMRIYFAGQAPQGDANKAARTSAKTTVKQARAAKLLRRKAAKATSVTARTAKRKAAKALTKAKTKSKSKAKAKTKAKTAKPAKRSQRAAARPATISSAAKRRAKRKPARKTRDKKRC